jgi:hypothetical protein
MNTRTVAAVNELRDALTAEYRLTVAGRGLAEAEYASRKTTEALESVRHWVDKVRALEDARVFLVDLKQALENV